MAYLLDTHVFYGVVRDSALLRDTHRQLLMGTQEPVFVSAVSGWEIATKVRLDKWADAAPLLPGLDDVIVRAGLENLPLTIGQAERAGSLLAENKDPFDRLLAAQALDLGLTILTVDPAIASFGCVVG